MPTKALHCTNSTSETPGNAELLIVDPRAETYVSENTGEKAW